MYEELRTEVRVNRQTLSRRKAQVVDAWRENGELVQVWKDQAGQLYQGMAASRWTETAWQPVREVM